MNPIETLKRALANKDAEQVEDALIESYGQAIEESYVATLVELLGVDWHYKHEDIASELQRLKSSKAVEILYQTAKRKFNYLEYDDSHALARKCTWALADIGTPEARKRLESLMDFDDPEVVGYAKRRIENWNQELERK